MTKQDAISELDRATHHDLQHSIGLNRHAGKKPDRPADGMDSSFVTTTIVLAIFCGLGLAAFFGVYAIAPAEMIAHMTPLE
jgi:hypothetical protein